MPPPMKATPRSTLFHHKAAVICKHHSVAWVLNPELELNCCAQGMLTVWLGGVKGFRSIRTRETSLPVSGGVGASNDAAIIVE